MSPEGRRVSRRSNFLLVGLAGVVLLFAYVLNLGIPLGGLLTLGVIVIGTYADACITRAHLRIKAVSDDEWREHWRTRLQGGFARHAARYVVVQGTIFVLLMLWGVACLVRLSDGAGHVASGDYLSWVATGYAAMVPLAAVTYLANSIVLRRKMSAFRKRTALQPQ